MQIKKITVIVYLLYITGTVLPFLNFIGVFLSYVYYKIEKQEMIRNHLISQIFTFWLTLIYIIGFYFLSNLIFVMKADVPLLIIFLFWYLYRNISGLVLLLKQKPPKNIKSWFVFLLKVNEKSEPMESE